MDSRSKLRVLVRALRMLAGIAIVVGASGFLAGLVTTLCATLFGPEIEFPLGDPKQIVVNSQGRIYLGLDFYCRIQEYDAAGHF
jgi:hypothetical protein